MKGVLAGPMRRVYIACRSRFRRRFVQRLILRRAAALTFLDRGASGPVSLASDPTAPFVAVDATERGVGSGLAEPVGLDQHACVAAVRERCAQLAGGSGHAAATWLADHVDLFLGTGDESGNRGAIRRRGGGHRSRLIFSPQPASWSTSVVVTSNL